MATAGTIQLAPDSTGKIIDTSELTVSAKVVERQNCAIADPTTAAAIAAVMNSAPAGTEYGVNVRQTGAPPLPTAASKYKARDLAGTVQTVKGSAGTLFVLSVINTSGASAYVQVFDALSGNVTLGTTTPDVEILVAAGAQVSLVLPMIGAAFATAITVASTTAEKGNTGSAAGVEVFALFA